ncbi:MAG: signal peptide peptidase SppA [Saprospiraceae bacterium]|nr:signal peptide peptidase SppA [Saprospiraceae bacterium]
MKSFFSNVFSSCFGALLAMVAIVLIFMAIGAGIMAGEKAGPEIKDPTVLKFSLQDPIPEQSNNIPINPFEFNTEPLIGLHDLVKTIHKAAKDPKIKGIYLNLNSSANAYATLKEIRDALISFKESGKFIVSYHLLLDHKSYYLASVSDEIHLHPIGFVDLKGFSYSIPHFKEFADKIGMDFNIYYAGDFKSATEPFRMNKMSDSNRVQLREYQNEIFNYYIHEVAASRNLTTDELKNNFDQFLSYAPEKAKSNKLVDQLSNEADVYNSIRTRLKIEESAKINIVAIEKYYASKKESDEDYSSSNRIAVLYAEGDIIDDPGTEGQIGRKYLNILREIRKTNSIKALVLRVNSPGGSAIMSDDFLKEVKLIKQAGKPVVVSMGDYAASGGYYISSFADSIVTNPYTLTGSIGVFSLVPNFSKLSGDKIGIDFDTVGTGAYANTFQLTFPWGSMEKKILEENIENVYQRFLNIVSEGRSISPEETRKLAKGRIWSGTRAVQLNLANQTGSLQDAIKIAGRMASLEKYRISEFPTQKDPIQKFIDELQGKNETNSSNQELLIKTQLGKLGPVYTELKKLEEYSGKAQMRLPFLISL